MKNYDDNIKTHEWTRTHTGAKTFRWQSLQHIYFSRSHQNSPAELVKTETRRRRAASGPVLELPGERLEGIDFNKGFEQAVQLVAYNGRRFDFTVLKKQSTNLMDLTDDK